MNNSEAKELLDALNEDAHHFVIDSWLKADKLEEEEDYDKAEDQRELASNLQTTHFKTLVENHPQAKDIWLAVENDKSVEEWIDQYWPFDEPYSNEKAEIKRKEREGSY